MLLFDRADGDAEPVGNFLVGQQLDLAQEQHGATALGQLCDRTLEDLQLLAGHDFVRHPGGGGSG